MSTVIHSIREYRDHYFPNRCHCKWCDRYGGCHRTRDATFDKDGCVSDVPMTGMD